MSRTGDNIYQRKDGRWEGRYYKGRKLNGSIKYGYIYRKTKKETKRVLDLLKSMYAPKVTETSYSADLKFKEWLPRWMERIQSQVKPSTYSNYRYKLTKYIIPYFGQMILSKISEEEIYSYLNELEKNDLSAGSIHSIFTLFKQCLRAAISQFGGATSYLDAIKLPKRNRKKVGALSMVEQKRLTGVAQKAPRELGLPTLLALHTGMRIGEISALEWGDIDFKTNLISVTKTCQRIFTSEKRESKTYIHIDSAKSSSGNRVIPMTPFIRKKLLSFAKKSNHSNWVFSKKGKPSEPRLLTQYFHTLRKAANLPRVHFHQLRHTFATRCLEARSDIPTVSALLGHQSTKLTLDVYSDVLLEQRIQTIQKIAKYIS